MRKDALPVRATLPTASQDDVFIALERLGDLMVKGVLTDVELAEKKAE